MSNEQHGQGIARLKQEAAELEKAATASAKAHEAQVERLQNHATEKGTWVAEKAALTTQVQQLEAQLQAGGGAPLPAGAVHTVGKCVPPSGQLGSLLGVLPEPMPVSGNVVSVTLITSERGVNSNRAMDVVAIRRLSGDRSGGQMVVIAKTRITLTLPNRHEQGTFVLSPPLPIEAGQFLGILACDGSVIEIGYNDLFKQQVF